MSEKTPTPEIPQPEHTYERELSPEIVEMIMEKVQDINLPGTAFHTLNANSEVLSREKIFDEILQTGILGQTLERKGIEQQYKQGKNFKKKKDWAADMLDRRMPQLWFDILGRTEMNAGHPDLIKHAFWINNFKEQINLTIIFDISGFRDGMGTYTEYQQKLSDLKDKGSTNPTNDFLEHNAKIGTYWPASCTGPYPDLNWWTAEDETGRTKGVCDQGFVLLGRVAPRRFRGIVLGIRGKKDTLQPYSGDWMEEDPQKIQDEVEKIAKKQLEIYREKPSMLLPIYDIKGNLLWPKHLGCEGIKRKSRQEFQEKK